MRESRSGSGSGSGGVVTMSKVPVLELLGEDRPRLGGS